MVFFFKRVLRKPWDDEIVPRAINEHPLPRILSRTEIQVLLDATEDLKYKAMFAVMYSAGLHVSEKDKLNFYGTSEKYRNRYVFKDFHAKMNDAGIYFYSKKVKH